MTDTAATAERPSNFTPSWERKAFCHMCSVEWPQRYPQCPGCDAGKPNRREETSDAA